MTERRVYVRPGDVAGGRLTLRAEEAHHARRVLRLESGAPVVCFDGEGTVLRGRITAYAKDAAEVEVDEALAPEPEPAPRITLAQGLVKGERMDLIVQKATELGASAILPLRAERSDVRLDDERGSRRAERWRRIAVEAAKQCERARLPRLLEPATVDAALSTCGGADGPAVAFVERDGLPARGALEALGSPGRVTVFVGPEGGWSPGERDLLAERAALCLSLGPTILRAETAAIAALVTVRYALG